jgi:hypothetical protein
MAGKLLSYGDTATVLGIGARRVWEVHSTRVVKDTPEETVLALLPESECAFPTGDIRRSLGDFSLGTRWSQAARGDWELTKSPWGNAALMILTPETYYAVWIFLGSSPKAFDNYYVNFQVPYVRSRLGFDTYDLELDLVVEPNWTWRWKDRASYEEGIAKGGITDDWKRGVDAAAPR